MGRATLQWLSLVGVIWLQSINGTNSNLPAYSSQLKQLLSLSQLQLNNLALASDAGKLFGWLAGIAAIYLPLWLVLLIGSSLGLLGYGMQYLFLTHQISSLSYWHIFFLTVLAGNGICWINTVCYVVVINNFPFHRQTAVGLTTSYLGLSAVIYTAVVDAFSSNKTGKRAQEYLLLNSFLPVAVSLVTAPLVRRVGIGKAKRDEVGFVVILMITIATGINAVVHSLGPTSGAWPPWLNVVGVGVFLMVPLVIPLADCVGGIVERKWFISREARVFDLTTHTDEGSGTEPQRAQNQTKEEAENRDKDKKHAVEDIGVKLMLTRLNFWLYLFIYLSGATLGLVYLNNLGQIAESRGYSRTSSLVSLASAFVFFGRLLPSILDYAYSWRNCVVPGPASISVVMVPMAGAFFLLLNGTSASLNVSTAIIGFSTGVITAVSVSITAELFGPENFGVNHNIIVANIPLGSFVFGDLAAVLYRKQAGGREKCMGLPCYSTTFIIWGCLCSLGAALASVLYLRTRKFYLHRS